MNDFARSSIYVIVAVVLGALAWLMRPAPADIERFSDVGEPFYPEFSDPLEATSLEVIEFNEESGAALPFKVEFTSGAWTIPSHYNYPADGEDRLASTAAAVIDVRKDIIQSDRAQDHEALGLIDPLDETSTSIAGRGKRVTLRNASGAVLADFIIGDQLPDRPGFRYVRRPGQKRSYAAQINVDISTRFRDWINAELLELNAPDVKRITINDYSIDETTGSISQAGRVVLNKLADNKWTMDELPDSQQLDQSRIQAMVRAMAGLTITGVRPKPASMTADLRAQEGITLDLNTRLSLESRGFFVSQDGRLLSNEGEIIVGAANGVQYTLRFGEVLIGEGMEISAGVADHTGDDTAASAEQEAVHRYVFITAGFDESLLPPQPVPPTLNAADETVSPDEDQDDEDSPPDDAETNESALDDAAMAAYERQLDQWQTTADAGQVTAARLNDRFAEWYYVISASDFSALRPSIEDLIGPAAPETPAAPPQ